MPYYHVYIDRDGDEAEETDFSKEQLVENIIKPFSQGKEFICKGTIIDPHEITTIRVIETDKPATKLLPKDRKSVTVANILFGPTSDFRLLEEKGRDATRDFIRTQAEKRSKKKLSRKTHIMSSKKVFIAHGHDYEPVKELKTIVTELGLEPIVLHEQPSGSRTVVEKLEKFSGSINYAFVILTPDDMGSSKEDVMSAVATFRNRQYDSEDLLEGFTEIKFRARQNVILEFGYFIGKLGRDRVCCLYSGDIELPSDMQGIIHVPFKDSLNEVRNKIVKELKEAKYEIRE